MARKWIMAATLAAALLGAPVHAAAPKTYQVTGPVLALTDDTITVKKGSETWEIARDSGVKVTGDLKVGATVTIQYRMSAASIDVKPEKGSKTAAKKSAKKGS